MFRAEYIDAGIVGLPANANPKGKVVRRDDFLWFVRGTLIATAGSAIAPRPMWRLRRTRYLVEVHAVVKNGTPGGEDVCLLTSYSEARAELFRAWLLARVAELEPAQGVTGWPAPGIRP